MPHWGEKHVLFSPVKCVEYAKRMIDAGADAVFGSHSNCISTYCSYKDKPIYFGMGNFLYPDNCLKPFRPFYYPQTTEEFAHMPRCVNNPKSVVKPTICVWGKDSRIGLVVETLINNKMTTKVKFVKINNNNVLNFYRNYSMTGDYLFRRIVLPISNLITRMPFYGGFYRMAYRISRSVTYRFSDFRHDV